MGDAGGVFTGQRTDGPGRVKAIHDRHLYIHEDRGVFPRSGTLKQVHGHLAVLGVDDPQVYVAKQIFKDFSIQSVIFGKEERLSTEEAALLRVFSGCIVFFCRFGALQRDIHGEARSLPSSLSTAMEPPIKAVRLPIMASPSPLPDLFRRGGHLTRRGGTSVSGRHCSCRSRCLRR